jgi:pyruvate formate lyase activating enzyme
MDPNRQSYTAPAPRTADLATGLVFNVQKYSLHDGPGIRTTVFLKGCPLACAWCHNPESQSLRPEILVAEGRCLVCGQCRAACPFGQTLPGGAVLPPRNAPCTHCGACVEACPTGARQRVGQHRTVAEVLAEVESDRVFYDESAGGVTFSGGEPLSQPAFLKALLAACRARGLRTAVDTCGFGGVDDLLACARLTDLFLYDLKLMDDAKHRHYCGAPVGLALRNLQALAQVHACIWVRVPIIPGVNDSLAELQALAKFVTALPQIRRVNLLPYHKTGARKFRRLGLTYTLEDLQPPAAQRMGQIQELFGAFGLDARIGG